MRKIDLAAARVLVIAYLLDSYNSLIHVLVITDLSESKVILLILELRTDLGILSDRRNRPHEFAREVDTSRRQLQPVIICIHF